MLVKIGLPERADLHCPCVKPPCFGAAALQLMYLGTANWNNFDYDHDHNYDDDFECLTMTVIIWQYTKHHSMTTLIHDNVRNISLKNLAVWRRVSFPSFPCDCFGTRRLPSLQPGMMWCVTVDCIPLILPFLSMDPSVSWNRCLTGILWVISRIHVKSSCINRGQRVFSNQKLKYGRRTNTKMTSD